MNGISVKYLVVCGILLLSLVQLDGASDNQPVEAHLDLIQDENQITIVGSVVSSKHIVGARIRIYILRCDRSIVHVLLDNVVDLQATDPVTLKDLDNGNNTTFSLDYLYGKYIVKMEIGGGSPSVSPVKIEKSFQTKLIFLKEDIPADIPDAALQSQQNQYYLPCCSSKVAEDLNAYFELNWTEEQIALAAERIESEIYPRYTGGFSDLNSYLNDLNTILELNLEQAQIYELIYGLENGLFSPRTDAPLPQPPDEITEQAKDVSDSSAPFLTGKNVIARIYVNDPRNTWNADDRNTAWQQISTAANQILNWAPSSANVSFVHVSFTATLDETPDYSAENPLKGWMEDVMEIFGYPNTSEFAKAIKTTYNADHVIQLFLPHTDGTSYALPYPYWKYGERACVFFYASCFIVCIRNDEGPYKHETLHLYGACDEYHESQCTDGCGQCTLTYDTYRYLYLNSENCEYCIPNPVPCIMRSGANNDHAMNDYICSNTRNQIGWGDTDGDGTLDPLDSCLTQPGTVNNDGCPYSGFGDIPYLFSSGSSHVVGEYAKCTDVLGTANVSWVYGFRYIPRPEGKTNTILTQEVHETNNLIIVGGPAVNPLAVEFDSYFGITYVNQPGVKFTMSWGTQSISLDLPKYPSEDICIVYVGKKDERNALVIWGYGWQGTYAGSVFMSVPQVWNAYSREHVLLMRWKDDNQNNFIEFSEIHPENVPEVTVYPPPPGTPQLVNPVFGNIPSLFAGYTFHVVGEYAKCTDVLGTANVSWAYGFESISRPEGKVHTILTANEHNNGNLIPVGGPAVNPLATEFDTYFGISYTHVQNVSFTISCRNENKSIYLDLKKYPLEDICIVYLGRNNSRNIFLIWGYGWQGTYAGSVFMSDIYHWSYYGNKHLLLLRWRDSYPYDGYIQIYEIFVEAVV